MPFDPDKYLGSKEGGFSPDDYLKKKVTSETDLEVGSEVGGLYQTPAPGLESGYQKIAESGKIPINPFEQSALGQPPVDEEVKPVFEKPKITARTINPEYEKQGLTEENWKALKSRVIRKTGGIVGIPALIHSTAFEFIQKPILKGLGVTDEEIDLGREVYKAGIPQLSEQSQAKFNQAASSIENTMKQYEYGVIESIQKEKYGDAARQLLKGFVQSLPDFAFIGATLGGGTPAVLSSIGVTSASERKGSLEEQGILKDEPGKRDLNSWLYGGFEAAGEYVTAGIIGNFKRTLQGASKETIKKASDEIAGEFLREFRMEGRSGAATELGQQISDYFMGLRDNIDLKEVGDAYIIEGFAVAPISGTTAIANKIKGARIASKEDVQKVQSNQEKIVDLKDKLESTDNPVIKETINEEISQAEKENNDIAEKNAKLASQLTPDQLAQVTDINSAIDENDSNLAAKKANNEEPVIEEELGKALNKKRDEIIKDKRLLHERLYEESIAKKSEEDLAKMPTYSGKKFSLATILPNGDISNVYVRSEGNSHRTYMSPEDADAYESGRMTIGFWNGEKFIEAPQKGKEFGAKVMDIAASKVKIPEVETKITEEPKDAKEILKTQEQVSPGGDAITEGKGNGSQNIQQPEEAGAKASDEKGRLVTDEMHLIVSADTKSALEAGEKKRVIEFDESGNPVVKEVDFDKGDADVELERLGILAERGKLTIQEFQNSYFGQVIPTNTFGEVKKIIATNPVEFINKLKGSFLESETTVLPLIIKSKIESSGTSLAGYTNQIVNERDGIEKELKEKYGRKDGTGYRSPKNKREDWELRNLKNQLERANNKLDDLEKYKGQLQEEVKPETKKKGGKAEDKNLSFGYKSLNPNHQSLDQLSESRKSVSEAKDLTISKRVISIMKKLGVPIAEKYVPKKYLGLFKLRGKNIRVQSIIDVVVATHEAAHFISDESGIGRRIRTENKMGRIRKQLSDIYVEFYPGAKYTHSLEKRVEEGIAVLFEHYFSDPTYVATKYPELVKEFINPNGSLYTEKFGTLLDEMNKLVDEYAQLSDEQKIASRIIRSDEVLKRNKGFTWAQKLRFEFLNRFEPFARAGKTAEVSETLKDPFVHAFQWMNRGTFVHDWIKGNAKMVIKKDGNWETRPGTVRDYLKLVEGKEKEFSTYLVARRVLQDYQNLVEAQNILEVLKSDLENFNKLNIDDSHKNDIINTELQIKEVQKEVDRLNSILVNDGFNTNQAATVVRKYEKEFAKATDLYDGITKAMIDFSENTGLISSDIASKYRSTQGYAPFFRFVHDELLPENVGNIPSGNAQTKAKMFKSRTGSRLDIVDPVYNQMIAISEIINKGLENNIWVNVAKIAKVNDAIAQSFEYMPTTPFMDEKGNVSYPQDKDKNLMKVWINGKRSYYKIAPEFVAVAKNLRGEEWGLFRQLIQLPSATFTRLTTSANPLFALGNVTIDQLSAYMQSKTGFKPGISMIDSFVEMVNAASKLSSEEETLFRKYVRLGGRRQTFAAFHELSPEKTIARISGENKFDKAIEKMDMGLTALELPSNLSEYMTRFAEFKRAIKMGKTETEAMYMASQVTTPFQLYGNWYGDIGRTWIKSMPYFNAAVQVNYKFIRTIKDNPNKVAIMTSALLATALGSALLAFTSGSDDQKRLLANMPAREMARAIFFPHPFNKKRLIRIRVPENIGALTGLAYLAAIRIATGQKARYKDYVETATAFIPDQFNPLKPTQMAMSWIPQVLSPSIETAANIKTYPDLAPIVPDYLLENAPPELQYTDYTAKVAVAMGDLMNVSPAKLEHWVRNQFGVIGGAALGKLPNNPLIRQEQEHVTSGRAYKYFYEDKTNSSQQYGNIGRKLSYSNEEKAQLATEYVLYNKMGNVLSNMKRTVQESKNLPEPIRQSAFELLIRINNGERGDKVYKDMENLNSDILKYANDGKFNIGTKYNVTKESIKASINTYIYKATGSSNVTNNGTNGSAEVEQVEIEQTEVE